MLSQTELQTHLRALDGIRTRDTVVNSEVSDLFTTGAALGLSGNGRERGQATPSQSIAARTRDTTALAEPPPRYDACAGWIRTNLVQSEVSALFTTDKLCFQGNGRRGLGFTDEELRVFTTWKSQNSPSAFPHDKNFGEAGNKNPSGAWAQEGFETRTLWNELSSFRLHEKACARRLRTERMAHARSTTAEF